MENLEVLKSSICILDTHLYSRWFTQAIFVVLIQIFPLIDVIDHRLFLPLSRNSQFHHTNNSTGVVEAIYKLWFKLSPTINETKLQICVLVESITLQWSHELFYKKISIGTSIIASYDKVSHILLGISFPIELLKLWRLIANRHSRLIDSLRIWLSIIVDSLRSLFVVLFDCNFDEVFQLVEEVQNINWNTWMSWSLELTTSSWTPGLLSRAWLFLSLFSERLISFER